jgi:LmbE family N-acetylglucosaminyl deacetylase
MTDGRHALSKLFDIYFDPSPLELREIRKEEAKRATSILGIHEKKLFFLGIEDGELAKTKKEVQREVSKIVKDYSPEQIYYPQKREVNPDHYVTNTIIKYVISKLKSQPIEYQYVITWSFPYSYRLFTYFPKRLNRISIDISKFLNLKRLALEEYVSQLRIISPMQYKPVLPCFSIKNFLKKTETFLINK